MGDQPSIEPDGTADQTQWPQPMAPGKLVLMALLVEGILLLVSGVLTWFAGFYDSQPPWTHSFSESWIRDSSIGVLLAVLLLIVMRWWISLPNSLSRSMQRIVDELLGPLFSGLSVWQVAVVSIAAGFCEEIFFRGCLQGGLTLWLPVPVALAVASLFFGVCHWVNLAYAVMAAAIGLILGLQMIFSEGVWMPIVCHAAYDFLAILSLRTSRGSLA